MESTSIGDTPPYGHALTYQISLTYLERQKCYGPDKKILFKKQLFDLEVKGQGPTKVITVRDTSPYQGVEPIWLEKGLFWLETNKMAGSKTRKSENTEAQNEYLKGHILKSPQPRIKI